MSAQPAKRPPSEVNGHAQGNKMPRTTPPAGEDAEAAQQGNGRPAAPTTAEARPKLPALYYKEGQPLKDLGRFVDPQGEQGNLVEVRIPGSSMGSNNSQVRSRQLWGVDVYTQDSDVVAVLLHTGYFSPTLASAPASIQEFRAVIKVQPGLQSYPSRSQNGLRSRAWAAETKGCAYSIEECWLITGGGIHVKLEPSLDGPTAIHATYMPRHTERTMHTRSSNDRRQRTMQEVTVQYNLVNEPWHKYSISNIADHGLKRHQWTSAKLLKHVLLFESETERFEISIVDGSCGGQPEKGYTHRLAKCRPISTLSTLLETQLPLEESQVEVLVPAAHWEEFHWAVQGLHLQGTFYPILRYKFVQRSSPVVAPSDAK